MGISLDAALQALIGEQLSSVTFVMDYGQLSFGDHRLTVFNPAAIAGLGYRIKDRDERFKNYLCDRISHKVVGAACRSGDCLTISVDDEGAIDISLRQQDYRGPEAINFHPHSSEALVYVV
jgi:hypothetical protein